MANCLFSQCLFNFQCGTAESHHFLADAFLNNFIETDERAAANEKNFLRINLDVLLMRMFASTLWWNITCADFQNFQQGLLHSFAGDVPSDAHVVGFTADLVDLVNVNDPD